ncbi:hypothetical protein FRC02_007433 [Tulasnella sp. 418]|nr:hypothetical protein FRC02_007433 [Tulasnella sp. 418]
MIPQHPPASTYVRLIHEVEHKWATWDPEEEINVGDFGTLDLENGEFKRAGNLYTTPQFAGYVQDLYTKYAPHVVEENSGIWIISSKNLKRIYSGEPVVGLFPGEAPILGGDFEFRHGPVALLILDGYRIVSMPKDTPLQPLIASHYLDEYVMVTSVVRTPRFTRYYADSGGKHVSVHLGPRLAKFGDETQVVWDIEVNADLGTKIIRASADHSYNFTPLCTMSVMKMADEKRPHWYEGRHLKAAFRALVHPNDSLADPIEMQPEPLLTDVDLSNIHYKLRKTLSHPDNTQHNPYTPEEEGPVHSVTIRKWANSSP